MSDVTDDIEATFVPRFAALARTRLASALDATTRRDAAALAVVIRDMHSIAGEAGLLGLREVVPLARDGEARAKKLCAEPGDQQAAAMTETLHALQSAVEAIAARFA
jgi:HPt (histidine-containing phosphotransfer) domain-containing protein